MSMTTKLGRKLIYLEGLPLIKVNDTFIAWPCEITWHVHTLHFNLKKAYEHQTIKGDDLLLQPPTLKVTWPFYHVTSDKREIMRKIEKMLPSVSKG